METEFIRINKFLSEAGVCSRRGADRLVEEGRVTIDGKVAVLGDQNQKELYVRQRREKRTIVLIIFITRNVSIR